MSLLDKRSVCLRVTRYHRRVSSSCDSLMDETDREVSTLTDRAFRSLCIGDEAVYSDAEFGLSPLSGSCLLKPLADEHSRKVAENAPGLATQKHGSNGATTAAWQHKNNVSSLLSAFTTGKNGDGAKMANGMLAESGTESWDKSALLSIQRELAEFSTDFHSGFVDNKKHGGSNDKKSSKKSGKDTSAKSNSKAKTTKYSSKLRKLNIRNFFLHSEFSPFQAWKDLQHFPFGQEHASHISDLLPSDSFPRWGDSAFYRHLTAAHTLDPQTHTLDPQAHTPVLNPAHRPGPESQGQATHTDKRISQKTETAQRSQQHSLKHSTAQPPETAQKPAEGFKSAESGQTNKNVPQRRDPEEQDRVKSPQVSVRGGRTEKEMAGSQRVEGLQGVQSLKPPLGGSTELLARPGETDTPSVAQTPSALEPVAPWRRNRVRARSAAPAGQVEKCSPAVESRPPTSTELPRKQPVRSMDDQSSDSVTPFNITHLLTPVIPCRQDTESLDPVILPALFSPTTLEVPSLSASERKPSPDTKARESYRSIASSLLFNLKDNRKRVKARYSPPKFRPTDPCDPTRLDWAALGKDLPNPDGGSLGKGHSSLATPVMGDGTDTARSPVLGSTSALALPGNQRTDSRSAGLLPGSGDLAEKSVSRRGKDQLSQGTTDSRSPAPYKAGVSTQNLPRRASPEAHIAMETQKDREASTGQGSQPIKKEKEPPKKSVKDRVKELQSQSSDSHLSPVNKDSARHKEKPPMSAPPTPQREKPTVCPPAGSQTFGPLDTREHREVAMERPPGEPVKPSVVPKPAKQPPPVPARVKLPPMNETHSSPVVAEVTPREAAFSSEAKHAFSARQNNYIKSQRSAALLEEEEESEDWDEAREVALLKQMQAEIQAHQNRQLGQSRAQPSPNQSQQGQQRAQATPNQLNQQSNQSSRTTNISAVNSQDLDSPKQQEVASPAPERQEKKGPMTLKGNTQAKRHLFSQLEQSPPQPPARTTKNVEVVDKYDLATMALEEVIAEREERKRKGQEPFAEPSEEQRQTTEHNQLKSREPSVGSRAAPSEQRERELGKVQRGGGKEGGEDIAVMKRSSSSQSVHQSERQAAPKQGHAKQGHSAPVKLAQDGRQQELPSNQEIEFNRESKEAQRGQKSGGVASIDKTIPDRTGKGMGQADQVSDRVGGQGSLDREERDRTEQNGESELQRERAPPAVPPRKGKPGVRDEERTDAEGEPGRADEPTSTTDQGGDHTHTPISTRGQGGDHTHTHAGRRIDKREETAKDAAVYRETQHRQAQLKPASRDSILSPVSRDNKQPPANRDSIHSPANRDSIQSPASRDSKQLPASRESIQSPASRDSILSPASRDSIQSPASRDSIQSPANRDIKQLAGRRDSIQSPASRDSIQSLANRDSKQLAGRRDSIQSPASRDSIQSPANRDSKQLAGRRDSIQSPASTASESNQSVNQECSIQRETNTDTEKSHEKYKDKQHKTETISATAESSSQQSVPAQHNSKCDTALTHTPKVKECPDPTKEHSAKSDSAQKEGDSERERVRERDGEICGQREGIRERDVETCGQKEQKVKQGRSYVKGFLSMLGLSSEERGGADEDTDNVRDISQPDAVSPEPHGSDAPPEASVTIHDILKLQSPVMSPSLHSDGSSSHRAKEHCGNAELDYCVFSNPGSESDASERLMMSPLSDMDKGGWVRSLIEHAHNLTPVSVTPSQSNASSPTPAKPVLFKVKDNTCITSPVTKTVRPILHKSVQDLMAQPWSPQESLSGSERGSERGSDRGSNSERNSERCSEDQGPDRGEADPKRLPQIPILVETASSPLLEDSSPLGGAAPAATAVPSASPSQKPLGQIASNSQQPLGQIASNSQKPLGQIASNSQKPQGQLLTVPEEEAGRSSVSSGISSGLSESMKSTGDTCDEMLLSSALTDDTEGSKAPSEHSGSVCSGTEGSGQSRKPPPAVLPKTEKALRRAMKLTTRRIQKAEGKGSRTDRKHHGNGEEGTEHSQKNRRGKGENRDEPEKKSSSKEKSELKQKNRQEERSDKEHQNRDGERHSEREHQHRDRERAERSEREHEGRDKKRVGEKEREHQRRDRETVDHAHNPHSDKNKHARDKSEYSSHHGNMDKHARDKSEYSSHHGNVDKHTRDKPEYSGHHGNIDLHARDKSEYSNHHSDRKGRSGEKQARLKQVSQSTDRHIGNHRNRSHGNRRDSTEHAPVQPFVRQSPSGGAGSYVDRRSRSLERDVPVQSEVLHHPGRRPQQPHDIITAGRRPQQPHDLTTMAESSAASPRQTSLNGFTRQDSSEQTHPPLRTRQESSEHTHHASAGHRNSIDHAYPPSMLHQNSSEHTHQRVERQHPPSTLRQNSSEHTHQRGERQHPPSMLRQNSYEHTHQRGERQHPPSAMRQHSSDFSYSPSIGRQNSSDLSYPPSSSNLMTQSYPMTQRKLLQDPDSGQYFVVDMPVQVTTKTFFDPETSSYVQLPVQPAEGAIPSGPPLEMLNPSLVVYHGFVPVPVSSRHAAKAASSSSSAASRARSGDTDMEHSATHWQEDPMHKRNEHPYIEPVYVPKDHTPEEELDSVR